MPICRTYFSEKRLIVRRSISLLAQEGLGWSGCLWGRARPDDRRTQCLSDCFTALAAWSLAAMSQKHGWAVNQARELLPGAPSPSNNREFGTLHHTQWEY